MAKRRKKCPHCEFRSASVHALGGHMGYHERYGKEWRPGSAVRAPKNGESSRRAPRRAGRVPAEVIALRGVHADYAGMVAQLEAIAGAHEAKAQTARRIIQDLANMS